MPGVYLPNLQSVVFGDLDGDGVEDMISLGSSFIGPPLAAASVLLGSPAGGFNPPSFEPSNFIACSPFDQFGDGVIQYLASTGGGSLGGRKLMYGAWVDGGWVMNLFDSSAGASSVGDFDGDGRQDIVESFFPNPKTVGGISVLYNLGDGGFRAQSIDSRDRNGNIISPSSITPGDFNGDGQLDFLGSNRGAPYLFLRVDGGFRPLDRSSQNQDVFLPTPGLDFDGDGIQDIVLYTYGNNSTTLQIQLNFPDGGFTAVAPYGAGSAIWFDSADVNGDGAADLIAVDWDYQHQVPTGRVDFYLGLDAGGLAAPHRMDGVKFDRILGAHDVDHDGIQDLIVGVPIPDGGALDLEWVRGPCY